MNFAPHHKLAGASVAPAGAPVTMTCPECNGAGEDHWMALDATEYSLEVCPFCDGKGRVEARCNTCDGKLVNGWCSSCEDEGLCFVERIAPGRVAL